MHWLLFNHKIKSPVHVSSLKCSSSGGYSCTHAAYGTVTLCESSWWPVGIHLEWELTGGGRFLVGVVWKCICCTCLYLYYTVTARVCTAATIRAWITQPNKLGQLLEPIFCMDKHCTAKPQAPSWNAGDMHTICYCIDSSRLKHFVQTNLQSTLDFVLI